MSRRGYTKKEANRRRTRFMVTLITWLRGDLSQVIDNLKNPIINAFE